MLRHAVSQVSAFLLGVGFWGTLFVNITGSFAMGVIAGWFAFRREGGGQSLRLFLTTGILGGFTTFSTFSLDAALFWERGQLWGTAGYVSGSVLSPRQNYLYLSAELTRPCLAETNFTSNHAPQRQDEASTRGKPPYANLRGYDERYGRLKSALR